MIQATTSFNCSPIKPSFKKNESNTALIEEAANLIKDTDNIKDINEDTMERLKDIVEKIEVNPDSKVQGPLKTFTLSLIALATGTLLSRGTATKGFYLVKDKKFAKDLFQRFGSKFVESTQNIQQKAESAEQMKKLKKYTFKALNYICQKANDFSEKGIDVAKGAPEYAATKAEKLIKKGIQSVGSLVGLTSTGAALSVDHNNNGKSDMLEFREKKKEQKAIIELASAVIDSL